MDLYAENILEHFRDPQHTGVLIDSDQQHHEGNPTCGDDVTLYIKVVDGVLTDMTWEGTGCAISQAAMSMLSDEVIGETTADIVSLSKEDILELLGVPVSSRRMKCALLGLHALKNALRSLQGEERLTWLETIGTH